MNRREFMVMGAAGAVMAGAKTAFPAIVDAKAKHDAPPRNRRPYSGLDWSSVKEVHTTSHGHCTGQKMLDGYLERGLGLITMSNYYPSAPYVPASKMTQNYYAVHHEHPVMVKGKRVGAFRLVEDCRRLEGSAAGEPAQGHPVQGGRAALQAAAAGRAGGA